MLMLQLENYRRSISFTVCCHIKSEFLVTVHTLRPSEEEFPKKQNNDVSHMKPERRELLMTSCRFE